MLIFNKLYFLLTILLFLTEVFIGTFISDTVIRPYAGDFLVVILVYCFVKTFFETAVAITALGVLLFAYVVEVSQYFHLVTLLGLQHYKLARIAMGTSFSFIDLLTYTLGIILVIITEKTLNKDQYGIPFKR